MASILCVVRMSKTLVAPRPLLNQYIRLQARAAITPLVCGVSLSFLNVAGDEDQNV
jgi:hypothetical protein